ncbi:hypothetical protein HY627_01185 [Candidatus Uhrbacteria bacterium]|nr:hypothetical protein [Candidatus Uhrbacteria bacterium]
MTKCKYWIALFILFLIPSVADAQVTMPAEVDMTTPPLPAIKPVERKVKPSSYTGVASWYAHKRYPNGAATNLFPLGTKLKVTHKKTGKSIVVKVTSTWTQKDPKRVVDIVSTGFKKLASLSTGLIHVKIEKL